MHADYWHEKWSGDRIAFHQDSVNKRLQEFWKQLDLAAGAAVFVPLCGKSLDMLWLHRQGHPVLGVEFSEKAGEAFFRENDLDCTRSVEGDFLRLSGQGPGQGIELLIGDFFALTPAQVAHCQGVYDRAAMIALDGELRNAYAHHLGALLVADTRALLLTISYDQARMQGPPFSVSDDNARELLSNDFRIEELAYYSGPRHVGNLADRGLETLDERVYLLTRKS